jgi:microcystin-dependent protein
VSNPFVGEIRMFGGNFAPAGWAFCDGQLLPISENDVLFNLIGTTYGGDGQSTFALPDLRGRAPVHAGQGNGLSNRTLGENGGEESVTLTTNQVPLHSHAVLGSLDAAAGGDPTNQITGGSSIPIYHTPSGNNIFNPTAVSNVGGNQPHENMGSFLTISFIISLFGVYPQQS